MAEILVVDDEIGIRELLSEILGDEGHAVLLAESAREARAQRDANRIDLVLLDIWMPDTDGVTLLKEWATGGKLTMPVIMMSGHATIDTAVEATRIGAFDFLEKPITMQKLLRAVEAGLNRNALPGARRVVNAVAPSDSLWSASEAAPTGSAPAGVGSSLDAVARETPFGMLRAVSGVAETAGIKAIAELPLELPLREARDVFERAYFEHHLMRENGSMTRVAEKTGLERTHLYRKLKQLGIDLSSGLYRKNNP